MLPTESELVHFSSIKTERYSFSIFNTPTVYHFWSTYYICKVKFPLHSSTLQSHIHLLHVLFCVHLCSFSRIVLDCTVPFLKIVWNFSHVFQVSRLSFDLLLYIGVLLPKLIVLYSFIWVLDQLIVAVVILTLASCCHGWNFGFLKCHERCTGASSPRKERKVRGYRCVEIPYRSCRWGVCIPLSIGFCLYSSGVL